MCGPQRFLLSAANMHLKLGEAREASTHYATLAAMPSLTAQQAEMVRAKQAEARLAVARLAEADAKARAKAVAEQRVEAERQAKAKMARQVEAASPNSKAAAAAKAKANAMATQQEVRSKERGPPKSEDAVEGDRDHSPGAMVRFAALMPLIPFGFMRRVRTTSMLAQTQNLDWDEDMNGGESTGRANGSAHRSKRLLSMAPGSWVSQREGSRFQMDLLLMCACVLPLAVGRRHPEKKP